MMTKGMRKSYMQTMKIWPRAVELHPATRQPLPERDDDWRLTMMDEDEGAYRLQNTLTRHILDLYKDDIIGFRSRGVLMLRGTTTLCGDDVIFEPFHGSGPWPTTGAPASRCLSLNLATRQPQGCDRAPSRASTRRCA